VCCGPCAQRFCVMCAVCCVMYVVYCVLLVLASCSNVRQPHIKGTPLRQVDRAPLNLGPPGLSAQHRWAALTTGLNRVSSQALQFAVHQVWPARCVLFERLILLVKGVAVHQLIRCGRLCVPASESTHLTTAVVKQQVAWCCTRWCSGHIAVV
jgi:hypothetical protein